MRRFGANKIHLSETECYCNAVLEISDDNRISRIISLDNGQETSGTPFYNGILVPTNDTATSITIGDTIHHLTLLEGERLFTEGIADRKKNLF